LTEAGPAQCLRGFLSRREGGKSGNDVVLRVENSQGESDSLKKLVRVVN